MGKRRRQTLSEDHSSLLLRRIPLRPAVFLDRDGTLNAPVVREGKPYPPASVDEFVLLEGVQAGCVRLKAAGYTLVVATNQPDVGRGTQKREVVEAMHRHLCTLVPEIDLIKTCYHGGTDYGQPCDCRKPKPTMLLEAAASRGIDLAQSWMIGDRWRDIDCGQAANCRTIFIDWGYAEKLRAKPDFIVGSFQSAVEIIVRQSTPH